MEAEALPQRPAHQRRRGRKRELRAGGGGEPAPAPAPAPAAAAAAAASPSAPGGRGGAGAEVEVDGSMLEGGGQILRNTLALSGLLGVPVRLRNIRAGRAKPGLRPQHLAGVQLCRRITACGSGAAPAVGDTELRLRPGPPQAGRYGVAVGTAGSCTLIAQAALPLLLATTAGAEARLEGGTDNPLAPPADFLAHVLLPTLRRHMGLAAELRVVRRGFYPKGRGELLLSVPPDDGGDGSGSGRAKARALDLSRPGPLTAVTVTAFCAGVVKRKYAEDMVAGAKACLAEAAAAAGVEIRCAVAEETAESAFGNGSGVLVKAETAGGGVLGGAAHGDRKKKAKATGREAAEVVLRALAVGAAVDEFLADQLIVFMALAGGISKLACAKPTLHAETAMKVMETMSGGKVKFAVAAPADPACQPWQISCTGLGIL